MNVILLERVAKLGEMGDVVTVKDGYARNFLLPTGRALRSTKANREAFEKDRAAHEARNAAKRSEAQEHTTGLEDASYVMLRQAGESGQLFGSVSTRDIAAAVCDDGVKITRNQVQLADPIKTIGLYPVSIALHPEVIVEVTINVARSQDEAEAQARGEILTGSVSDREEARAAAEELFADEEDGEDEDGADGDTGSDADGTETGGATAHDDGDRAPEDGDETSS